MSNLPFVAFYPSKWLARTAQLNAAERGVFITLICEMYERMEPVKLDRKRLARFCGTTPNTFDKILSVLCEDPQKIILKDGLIWNLRVEKEIKTAQKKSNNFSKLSHKRWEKHNKNNESSMRTDMRTDMQPDLEPEREKTIQKRFDEFWNVFSDKRGKDAALKVWKRRKLDSMADEVISGAREYTKSRGVDKRYWKQAQGWLNDGRWKDDLSSAPKKQVTNYEHEMSFIKEAG